MAGIENKGHISEKDAGISHNISCSSSAIDTIKIPSHPRKISFDIYEHSEVKASPSKCLRLSSDVSNEALWESLKNNVFEDREWHPELAITFLGGSRSIAEDTRECLRKFITSILEKFRCCLITRGSYVGVTKLIGKICSTKLLKWNYGYQDKSIGVLPYLKVYGREVLENCKDASVEYPRANYDEKNWVLDPNHSFYYFVDGENKNGQPRMDTKFIIKLNKVLLNVNNERKREDSPVPCVMILTGGGEESLEIMQKFLLENEDESGNQKPVVIILKGTGRLADLLSSILESYEKSKREVTGTEDECTEKASKHVKKKLEQIEKVANEALQNSESSLHGGKTLEEKPMKGALQSILAITKSERTAEKQSDTGIDNKAVETAIDLALKNCKKDPVEEEGDIKTPFENVLKKIEKDKERFKEKVRKCIAMKEKNQIITFELKGENGSKNNLEQVLLKAMTDAVKDEKSRFLFAFNSGKIGIVREYFKTRKELAYDMMTDSILHSNDLSRVKDLLEKYKFNVKGYVEERMRELYNIQDQRSRAIVSGFDAEELTSFYKQLIEQENGSLKNLHPKIDEIMKRLTDGSTCKSFGPEKNKILNPIQELFINSILLLDVNAAKLFWYFDPYNPLSNALLAYVLLNALKSKANKVSKSAPDFFDDNLKYFESVMCALLDIYYKINKEMASKALTQPISLWKRHRLIDVAGEIDFKPLFREQASQIIMDKEWNGERNAKENTKNAFSVLTTPRWKMGLHLMVYVTSLILFAVYVLFANTIAHEPVKWATLGVVVSLTVDELVQIANVGKGFCRSIIQWESSIWNKFDIFALLIFYTGFALSYYNEHLSKVLFSFYLGGSCLKVLQFLRAFPSIGVYLVMIREMVRRTKMFMIVFLLTILGYGLFMTALLHPKANLDWTILIHILFRPSLVLIGEPGVESFEFNDSNTVFGTRKVDVVSEVLVLIAMAVFLLFANILLVNLLIAEFSNIHSEVSRSAEEIWTFEQYLLLEEFKKKPACPIPLSIFYNLYFLLKKLFNADECMQKKGEPEENDNNKDREVAEFERFCFKKLFPTIPDHIIQPVVEEGIRNKIRADIDNKKYHSLGAARSEV